jgi:hypothetical protein
VPRLLLNALASLAAAWADPREVLVMSFHGIVPVENVRY